MHRVIERILNLLAFLLTADRPVTADEIRHTVAGYDQETDEAFRRTFERDKDLLRQLGIPLQLQPTDAWEVEHGYVVPAEEYALADPGLTDEERAALALAAQVVRLGGHPAGPGALLKLGGAPAASGVEPLGADLGAEVESLPELFASVTERRTLRFQYRDKPRTVHPYGLVHRRGHWYLIGAAGDDIRSFRVDRIEALVIGDYPDSFRRPPGFKASTALPSAPWETGDEPSRLQVRFDGDVAWWARRQLSAATLTAGPDGSLEAEIQVSNLDAFLGWMIGFEDQAEILAPNWARRRFVEHIEGAT